MSPSAWVYVAGNLFVALGTLQEKRKREENVSPRQAPNLVCIFLKVKES